ncbi:MAG: tRNA lysidine(34) synthetase TilS [Geminicoccaceae bacterium]
MGGRGARIPFRRSDGAFAPFEDVPLLAVAVSGGSDSMALALLADGWCRRRGGRLVSLVVDHGLRPESADEATTVVRLLQESGIEARVLRWEGEKPRTAIQERAREARLELLVQACRHEGALHLLLGHHRQDQEETVAMRLERGSGPLGLAGMSACREMDDVRLLRPLLGFDKAELREWLEARGIRWIEDPSNRDPRYWRARFRAQAMSLTDRGTVPGEDGAVTRKGSNAPVRPSPRGA